MVVRFQTSANANIKENCLTGYLCSLLFVWYELFVIDLKAFINSPSGKKAFIFHTLIWMHEGEVSWLAQSIQSSWILIRNTIIFTRKRKSYLSCCRFIPYQLMYNKTSNMKFWMLQDIPTSEILWYHVLFFAVMFLLIGLDWVMTRLCQ